MDTIHIQKSDYSFCTIDSKKHIEESLGYPIQLPPVIQDLLDEDGKDIEENLISLFSLVKGCKYERVIRDNTYNSENDLSQFFIFSVYAPEGCSDWMWSRDCFVLIEMGSPGDPRYVPYHTAEVFDLGDRQLGDCGFFDTTVSWWAEYVNPQPEDKEDSYLMGINDRLSSGYSGNPTYELGEMVFSNPLWSEKRKGFVARPKDSSHPMVFRPYGPCYN